MHWSSWFSCSTYQCLIQPSTPKTAIIPFPFLPLLQKMTRRAWEAGRRQKGELSLPPSTSALLPLREEAAAALSDGRGGRTHCVLKGAEEGMYSVFESFEDNAARE